MYDDTMTAEQAIATANTVAAKMEKWALQTQQRAEAQTGRAGYAWARARRMRALAQWALGESHIVDAFVRQRDLGLAIGAAQLLDVVATAEAEALAEAGFSDDDDATMDQETHNAPRGLGDVRKRVGGHNRQGDAARDRHARP